MRNVQNAMQKHVRVMVSRIINSFDPDKIILFGSYARGTAGPDSDVDLLIVMPFTRSKRETQLEIRRVLHDVEVSKDILVSTPEEYAWRKDVVGTIEYPATREGKVLYAKA